MAKSEIQKKYQSKFARPAILIDKNKNDKYKLYVASKGYNSLNDYFNAVIAYDIVTDNIPKKEELLRYIEQEETE